MMKRLTTVMLLLGGMLLCGLACEKKIEGEYWPNQPPLVYLSSGPIEGAENINYKVHFYWNGYDPDGNIDYFQYLITDDEVTGSLLIDSDIYATLETLGYAWTSINVHDSAFIVSADSIPDPEQNPGDEQYLYGQDHFLFRAQHTFFIRSVDELGLYSKLPRHVTFTASTIAPEVKITEPSDTGVQGGYEQLPTDIFFRWTGNDSVGDGSIIEPDFTRWTLLNRGDFGIDLEETGSMLDLPEDIWKNWLAWGEIDSTDDENAGTRTLLRNLTSSDTGEGGEYLFFVQAKDEAGAITSHFRDGVNVKKMRIVSNLQPSILVREASLGTRFSKHNMTYSFSIAEGQQLELSWLADASEYGSRISGYRFGWNILDTNNDEEWTSWSSANTSTTATYNSGTHVFYLEASDYSGTVTRLTFHFLIVPFTMENDLLLIDDFDNDAYENMADPPGYPDSENIATLYLTSDMMNQRWRSLLAEYDGFQPDRDFVKISPVVTRPPFQIVAAYAHLIWEVKESDYSSGLAKVSRFVDHYITDIVPYDYFSSYLERGGQALLCGYPAFTLMPVSSEMDPSNYERRMPLCFAKHFSYSQGSQSEFTTAINNFLLIDKFAVTTVEMNSNSSPRDVPFTGADYKHGRTFWGMRYVKWLGDEAASVFGMESPPVIGDSLRFSPLVYEWFDAAGPQFCINYDDGGELHIDYGLRNVEVYDWAWLAQIYTPPIDMPRNYYPLLSLIPSDSTTRWGSDPAEHHISYYGEHIHRNELRYSLTGERDHVVALISRQYPETPSVLMGFTPYYLDYDTADLLIDFIMGKVFEIDR